MIIGFSPHVETIVSTTGTVNVTQPPTGAENFEIERLNAIIKSLRVELAECKAQEGDHK